MINKGNISNLPSNIAVINTNLPIAGTAIKSMVCKPTVPKADVTWKAESSQPYPNNRKIIVPKNKIKKNKETKTTTINKSFSSMVCFLILSGIIA